MHCQRSNSFLPLTALLAALAGQASSQALRDSIVGCADVACPDRPHDIYPNCTLVDTSFNDIGLARIPGPLGSSRGLSWVQANAMDTSVFGRANVTKRFYFGQPPDLDLSNTGACALFFTEVSDRVKFNNSDVRLSQGTCDQAMPPACVGAITRRADNFDFAGLSGQDACSKLQSEFEQNLDNECAGIALGSQWSGLVSKGMSLHPRVLLASGAELILLTALSGAGSPKPITAQENATSNCWPITPKSESLAFVHGMESIVRERRSATRNDD